MDLRPPARNTPVKPPTPVPATGPLVYPEMGQIDQISTGQEPVPEEPEKRTSLLKTVVFGFLNWIIVPVAIVFILHNFVFQAFHVIGSSMSPTLHETDYLIISKVGATDSSILRALHKNTAYIPKRGEIIVFHYPKDPTLIFVKRVIALPGERVTVKNGAVTVYNDTHPSGFNPDAGTVRTQYPTLGDIDEIVPENNIFVLGDNRTPDGSYDSRDWGFLPSSYIIGNAELRLLPVDKATLF